MTARSRETYFHSLGIDVWVRRGTRSASNQASVRRPGDEQAAGESPSPDVSPTDLDRDASRPLPPMRSGSGFPPERTQAPVPDEAFRIRCFRYGRVFVAMAEDAWPMRRFIVDVAWASNGFQVAERDDFVFDWPQPGAVTGGGGRAFGAFFRHQTRVWEDVRVLLSGTLVATLLGHPAPAESCVLDGRLYLHPGIPDAESKRALWQRMSALGWIRARGSAEA